MQILEHECASGIWLGIKGAVEWAANVGSKIANWFKARLLDAKNLLKAAKAGIDFLGDKLKQGWDFLTGWFKDDPIGATAGVAAGILTAGVIVVSGGAVIGALGGGVAALKAAVSVKGLAAIGSLAAGGIALKDPIRRGIRHLVSSIQTVYNFNWNATDKDLRAQQQSIIDGLIVNAGGAVGRALGGLLCGATPGLGTVQINSKYLAELWLVIEDDTKEEILDALTELCYFTWQAARQLAFIETYKNVRKWIKGNVRTGIKSIDKAIAAWGAEGGKSWSLAETVEQWTESLDNKALGEALQEGIEEFLDSCTEAMLQVV